MSTTTINEGSLATVTSAVATGWVRNVLTFQDCYERAVAWLRAFGHDIEGAVTGTPELLRGTIIDSYETILNAYPWPVMEGWGRIHVEPMQEVGTVAYTSANRTLTISGASWPTWAEGAAVRIDNAIHQVQSRASSSQVILDEQLCPSDDLAAGTEYELFRLWYALPRDFGYMRSIVRSDGAHLCRRTMGDMQRLHQSTSATGDITDIAFGQHPLQPTRQALFTWPPPTAEDTLDFTYDRRHRDLRFAGYDSADDQGTVTVAAGSNVVTGSGTAFDDEMEGALLRWGKTSTRPTGTHGNARYAEQHQVLSVNSVTELVLLGAARTTRSAVGYVVTDPIVIAESAYPAILRQIEYQLAMAYRSQHVGSYRKEAEDALRLAAQGAQSHGELERGRGWTPGDGLVDAAQEDD